MNPLIASLRVMGTYPLNDTDQVLAMLESALPVRVSRRFDWWVTLEPAENKKRQVLPVLRLIRIRGEHPFTPARPKDSACHSPLPLPC
ncbi:hypothetical protein NWF32_01760 [Pseudomonas qingdaonensis]|nr:hypothetical protein [Pseudomonas qingdaonensis]